MVEEAVEPLAIFHSHIEVKSIKVAQASIMTSLGATPLSIQLHMGTVFANFPSKGLVVEQQVELLAYSLSSTKAKTTRSAQGKAQD